MLDYLIVYTTCDGRMGDGFWRRGGEIPSAVKWEDRIIEIREGSWSYVASSIGRAPGMCVLLLSAVSCHFFHPGLLC